MHVSEAFVYTPSSFARTLNVPDRSGGEWIGAAAAFAFGESLFALGGQLDDVLAAVVGAAAALYQAFVFELVDEGDHRGAVDAEFFGRVELGERFGDVENDEDGQLAAGDVQRLQGAGAGLGEVQLRVLQQVAESGGEGFGHMGHSTLRLIVSGADDLIR